MQENSNNNDQNIPHVIIDTDTASDDIFAILILLHFHIIRKIKIHAVTTVRGLVSASHGANIVEKLLDAINLSHTTTTKSNSSPETNFDTNAPLFKNENNEENTTPKIKILAGSDSPFKSTQNQSYHFFDEASWYLFYEESLLNAAQFLLSTIQAQAEVEAQLRRDPKNPSAFVFPPLPSIITESTVEIKSEQNQTKDVFKTSQLDDSEKSNPAVEYLLNCVNSHFINHKQKITLLCLGPLTNIARCIERDQDFLSKVESVVLMGGNISSKTKGNTPNDVSEWNIYADSLAANFVIRNIKKENGSKFKFMGLEIANFDVVPMEEQEKLRRLETSKSTSILIQDWFANRDETHKQLLRVSELLKRAFLLSDAACTFDPVAATFIVRPDLFSLEKISIKGVVVDKPNEGQIIESNLEDDEAVQVYFGKEFDKIEYAKFLREIVTLEKEQQKLEKEDEKRNEDETNDNDNDNFNVFERISNSMANNEKRREEALAQSAEDDLAWLQYEAEQEAKNNNAASSGKTLEQHLDQNKPSATEEMNKHLLNSFKEYMGKYDFDDKEEDSDDF